LWALLALIVFGIVEISVAIPHADLIWSVAGPVIFGGYGVRLHRLRRAGIGDAVPIAASIFLDVVSVFLFFLQPLGNENN
jgi:modulator of FtsH protease